MVWVKPIDQVEEEFRRRGVFLLVDLMDNKLRFYGYNQAVINQMTDSLKGRGTEMMNFLIARARAKGETAYVSYSKIGTRRGNPPSSAVGS